MIWWLHRTGAGSRIQVRTGAAFSPPSENSPSGWVATLISIHQNENSLGPSPWFNENGNEEMSQVVIKEGELGSLAPLGGDESTIRAQQVCFSSSSGGRCWVIVFLTNKALWREMRKWQIRSILSPWNAGEIWVNGQICKTGLGQGGSLECYSKCKKFQS